MQLILYHYETFVAVLCKRPISPKYGKVYVTGDYGYGSTAHYSCYNGYSIHGSAKIKCEYGIWKGKAPICIKGV